MMYKQKLQELCQQRRWALPLYTSAKDGPEHNPRFWASVTINGSTFDGPHDAPSRTSKEAQNEAARVAFDHFAPFAGTALAAPPPSPAAVAALPTPPQPVGQHSCFLDVSIETNDNPAGNEASKSHGSNINVLTLDAREMQHLYKSQLQSYAQKRNLNLPTYDRICDGSLLAPHFKASVTIDGQTFQSPQFFSTLKDAEHAAAKVAFMSLFTEANQEEDHLFYKNLLQELVQKEGLALPTYSTVRDGPYHMPTFISTVEIEGENFEGSVAKNKKQAESFAAKVAWTRLRERKQSRHPGSFLSSFQVLDIKDEFLSLPSMDSHLPRACLASASCIKPDIEENMITDYGAGSKDGPVDICPISSLPDEQGPHATVQAGKNGSGNSTACIHKPNPVKSPSPPLLSSDAVYARLRDPFPEESVLSDDEISPVFPTTECLGQPSADRSSVCSAGNGDGSLLCNRVRIYARRPDFQVPPGTKLLPFSDDKWVAVSVDPSSGGSSVSA